MNIVDIAHQITSYDLRNAAFVIRQSLKSFPESTIHLACVGAEKALPARILVVSCKDQYLLLPDNGLISLLKLEEPFEIRKKILEFHDDWHPLSYQNAYAEICAQLIKTTAFESIGSPAIGYETLLAQLPTTTESKIKGQVGYIDRFGNAITNISKTDFDQIGNGRSFVVEFRNYNMVKLSYHYDSVSPGEMLCLFNSADQLEIAISQGNASNLLALDITVPVEVSFK